MKVKHHVGKLTVNVVKMTNLPKWIYRFNAILIKILMNFKQKLKRRFKDSHGHTEDLDSTK